MLLVETFLAESPGKGIGLYAKKFIPAGEIVWKYDPDFTIIYHYEEIARMGELQKEFIKKYTYRNNDYYYLCVDNARFMNHSDNPNLVNDNFSNIDIAIRDINPGEEITCNYLSFCDDGLGFSSE